MVQFISPIKPNAKLAPAPKIGNISNEEDASTQPSLEFTLATPEKTSTFWEMAWEYYNIGEGWAVT
jgi:hypothetical protein